MHIQVFQVRILASASGEEGVYSPAAQARPLQPRPRLTASGSWPWNRFPGKPAKFFARPGEASSSRYLQRNRGLPAWQRDYTFFAASRDQEAVGSSVGTLQQGCLHEYSAWHTVLRDLSSTGFSSQYL